MRTKVVLVTTAVVLIMSACSSSGGDDDDGAASREADFCSFALELTQSVDAAVTDADAATFDEIESVIDDARDRAPEEIEEDLATLDEGFANVREVFAQYDYDLSKIMAAAAEDPELLTNLATVDSGEVEAAGNRVEAYVQENCAAPGATTHPGG
jgi:hypothetical protein